MDGGSDSYPLSQTDTRGLVSLASVRNSMSDLIENGRRNRGTPCPLMRDGFLVLQDGMPMGIGNEEIGAVGDGDTSGEHLDDSYA